LILNAEDVSVQITNVSLGLANDTIVFGDLARVAAEMLVVSESIGRTYGVARGDSVTRGYLRYVRGKGYSRAKEIADMIQGGVAAYEWLTSPEYKQQQRSARGNVTVANDLENARQLRKENALKRIISQKEAQVHWSFSCI
jgi:hypothetical protein